MQKYVFFAKYPKFQLQVQLRGGKRMESWRAEVKKTPVVFSIVKRRITTLSKWKYVACFQHACFCG